MKQFRTILSLMFILSLLFVSSSCKKDKLTGELDAFEGKYTWTHSWYKQEWWHSNNTYLDATSKNYTAEIEITNTGKILFYINGEQIHKTGYSIESQETIDGWLYLTVKPSKKNSKQIDLNNELHFSISADTLSVSKFPGSAYDNSYSGGNYFLRN